MNAPSQMRGRDETLACAAQGEAWVAPVASLRLPVGVRARRHTAPHSGGQVRHGQPLRLDNIASASFDRSPRTRHASDASATTRSVADSPRFISAARVAAAPAHADTSA